MLAGLKLFKGVDAYSINGYLEQCERRDAAQGEMLLSPETPNQNLYVILSGRLEVHLNSPDNPALTTLYPGSCAGEMSIIEAKDPSAYVFASEDTHLMVINHELLWCMINASHAFARNLLIVLSERVRADNEVIADNVDLMRQFERTAITDALTDLHNRHWLEDMFRRKITRSKKNEESTCLIMIDVDHFKRFNDDYGHLAGDHALVFVAQALRDHFRPTDLIARFGGDEFAVLLPETSFDDAMASAERVRKGISGSSVNVPNLADKAPVTVSLGVAEMRPEDTLETLLHNADSALYRAKLKGRNCVSN